MKHNWVVLLLISTSILFICGEMNAQDEAFRRSSSQKSVGISTDVAVVAMPVATLAGLVLTRDWDGLKQGAFTALTEVGASVILKLAIKEERPDYSNDHSFPSGHTGIAFANATFLQRRFGWKLGVPAYAVATYVGWGRIFSKKHHWWDVVAGAAIGAGCALVFTTSLPGKNELTLIPLAVDDRVGVCASFVF